MAKISQTKLIWLSSLFGFFAFPFLVQAANLYFSPSAGFFEAGKTYSVGVFVSSLDQAMNAASGVIFFPGDKLEITSLSKIGSIFDLWVREPSFSNPSAGRQGTINFEGIMLNPGFTGASGKIITVNFKIKAGGQAILNFSSGSILANDGVGTNILSGLGYANYDLAASEVKLDKNLAMKLKGKILLQVESRGEAWYIDPVSVSRFYLADGAQAYGALRKFGLGITNQDLAKIPVGVEKRFLDSDTDGDGLADKLEEGLGTNVNKTDTDSDGFNDLLEINSGYNPLGAGQLTYDKKLSDRLKGRIVLQVESRGQAWYIHTVDGKRYYMKDGNAAYQIMKFLSLGITNENIRKIKIGN